MINQIKIGKWSWFLRDNQVQEIAYRDDNIVHVLQVRSNSKYADVKQYFVKHGIIDFDNFSTIFAKILKNE